MKVALLVVGEMRGYIDTYGTWVRHLFETNPDSTFDIFVYTQRTSLLRGLAASSTLLVSNDPKKIRKIYGDKVKDIRMLEDRPGDAKEMDRWINEKQEQCRRENAATQISAFRQWVKVKNAWDMMVDHENAIQEKYDVVIRVRPDMGLQHPFKLSAFDLTKAGHFYDALMIGNRETMEWVCALKEYFGKHPNPARETDTPDNLRWRYAAETQIEVHLQNWKNGSYIIPVEYFYIRRRDFRMSGRNGGYTNIPVDLDIASLY